MAENSGRFRSAHGVSRRTMTIRRAKDDDARRIAERDAAEGLACGRDEAPAGSAFARSGGPAGLTERGTVVRRRSQTRASQSGRQVVVTEEGRVSCRLTGDRAASVRVAGGDTIIHYKSGDMVIRRGAKRSGMRKQALALYAAGYILLFGLYGYFLFTGTTTMTPREFVDRSFALREGTGILDLERAAYEVMRGSRTPAEVRVAETISFYDENRDPVHVGAGNRLTLLTAAKLARAIIEDEKRPEALREFSRPFTVYRETHLAGFDWPVYLSLYNAFGFFLILALFLWRPLMHHLGTRGKKTAVALRNARDSLEEQAAYKKRFSELSLEVTARTESLRAATEAGLCADRADALDGAARLAEEISSGTLSTLAGEERDIARRIGTEAALRACDGALEILRGRMGGAEHDLAIGELIAEIEGMGLLEERGAV